MKQIRNKQLYRIGKSIRYCREIKGFKQEEFALLAGLDRSYYGGVERGERNISILNLIRIAQALEVEVGELIPNLSELQE